jgi:hypothetical protein
MVKRSSLFWSSVDEKEMGLVRLTPVANVIKLFMAVSYDFS